MVIYLEVIGGTDQGLKFKAEQGLQIGRSRGQIQLNDPKISGLHAEIQKNERDQWVLVDLGSSNGLIINGRKVKKITLLPNVVFEVGRTQLRVLALEEEVAEALGNIITWRHQLTALLSSEALTNQPPAIAPEPLSQALKLRFIQGIQADQEFTIGYVPRLAGSRSLDIELQDEHAPEEAFRIHAGPRQPFIENLAPTRVQLNKKTFSKEPLNDGDVISYGNSLIKVAYLP
ncbi:MAG: FHA domain-containing protein [Bdellovibrionia bacterium]